MFKRMIILGVLSSILLVLVLVKSQTNSSVTNLSSESLEYNIVEFKISKIEGNKYYGGSDEGRQIIFSEESIVSGDIIQVDDVVKCYFERDNLGKGLVKVEKK
ncbi:hypothetical protein V7124_02990 [Neobacillus niacini]|uniref:hypothetical protein n=1 Tax=Neobacillus niacini TaxID=86668 RepID=UPI0030007875